MLDVEEAAFESVEDLSPGTVEVTFEAVVLDLRASMPDDVDSLSFVISEWPKVVKLVFILRSQVRLACELQGNATVSFLELMVGLDDKLGFLKGCVGSPPMPGAPMFEHGLDLFSAVDGVAGSLLVIKESVARVLLSECDIPGRVWNPCWMTLVSL